MAWVARRSILWNGETIPPGSPVPGIEQYGKAKLLNMQRCGLIVDRALSTSPVPKHIEPQPQRKKGKRNKRR